MDTGAARADVDTIMYWMRIPGVDLNSAKKVGEASIQSAMETQVSDSFHKFDGEPEEVQFEAKNRFAVL